MQDKGDFSVEFCEAKGQVKSLFQDLLISYICPFIIAFIRFLNYYLKTCRTVSVHKQLSIVCLEFSIYYLVSSMFLDTSCNRQNFCFFLHSTYAKICPKVGKIWYLNEIFRKARVSAISILMVCLKVPVFSIV